MFTNEILQCRRESALKRDFVFANNLSTKTPETEWEDFVDNGIEFWIRALLKGLKKNTGVPDLESLTGPCGLRRSK